MYQDCRGVETTADNQSAVEAYDRMLADFLCFSVDTGNTLKANGLEPLEHIMDISSRLIVNRASLKMKNQAIKDLVLSIEQAVENS